ncbi:Starch-binding associating with outer membrane [Chitinophaga costaii]|uniref:Starch-binding associating with outer membrane n=1 Tax=Chitinophaga costaii TaxID=1335309 RepID=A0A1C4CLZ0_9BACT|nr:RagB/SusD family nutrient uptake outer membrane protein [Chitinophaga costaii]PUZ27034.1 RagB/SusD family nutrient uptake outer membrane protein [Chitinophaga costaii]SCC20116.1 Starch-binding associating with outer membrane [Chitinophaga costaii]
MKHLKIITLLSGILLWTGCTKLDEKLQGEATNEQVSGSSGSAEALLRGVYNAMRLPYQSNDQVFALSEMSTDELIAPTRGGDWDDNGVWRVLHSHQWDGDNIHIRDAFNNLGGVVYTATDILQFNPSTQQAAEARFLRAFAMFSILDFFDQVPYRDPGEQVTEAARVRTGTAALDYIISEVNEVMPNLPDVATARANITKANKDAARVLLMKCYLNKGVFANRATPTFDNTDLAKVVTLADEIINSGQYTFSASYFDNFSPTNGSLSKENIFTAENIGGVDAGGLNAIWHTVMHYNQAPPGWNGWATLSDFYNKFTANDVRRGVAYPTGTGGPANPGKRVNVGFLVGQQYNLTTDEPLQDRTGAPLIFTPEVSSIETGNNLEVTGIRVLKYSPDYANDGSGKVDNDFVYYRYPDVLLMKAEALLRQSNAAGALPLVNQVRTARGVAALTSVDLDELLDERGREFYWECSRRLDLVRFGKFLQPWQEKPTDAPRNLLFPIPNQQLAVNANLKRNPGY